MNVRAFVVALAFTASSGWAETGQQPSELAAMALKVFAGALDPTPTPVAVTAPTEQVKTTSAQELTWGSTYRTFARTPKGQPVFNAEQRETAFERLQISLSQGANERAALESFLQKWPDHLMARLWLTRHFLRVDDPAAALNVIGETNEPADDLWQFWYWRGTAFLAAGQLDQARSDIEKAMEGAPEVADLWIQNAALEQQLGNHAGAVQLLQIAVSLEPHHAIAHLNLGYSYEHLGEIDRALASYQTFMTSESEQAGRLRAQIMRRIAKLAQSLHG